MRMNPKIPKVQGREKEAEGGKSSCCANAENSEEGHQLMKHSRAWYSMK